MDTESVAKSRLFRESYLPGGTVKLRNGSYAAVLGAKNSSHGLKNIDEIQLRDVIGKYVSEWEDLIGAEVSESLRRSLTTRSLNVQCPSEIYVSPFPLLLQCTFCKVIDFYQRPPSEDNLIANIRKRIRKIGGRNRVSCKRASCTGHMIQLPYQSTHRCGSIDKINIPFQVRRINNVVFNDRGGSFLGSSFSNMDTNEKVATALSMPCTACSNRYPTFSELTQRGTPITNGEGFFPHAVQYISLTQETGRLVSEVCSHFTVPGPLLGLAGDLAEGVVAGLLRIVPNEGLIKQLKNLIEDVAPDKGTAAAIEVELQQKQNAYDQYAGKPADPIIQTILDSLKKDINALTEKLTAAKGVFKQVRDFLPNDDIIKTLASERRTQESVFFRGAFREFTVKDRLQDEPAQEIRESVTQQWDTLKTRYNIDDILHISNLNVVLATIGFTREKRFPTTTDPNCTPVVLNAFEDRVDQSLTGQSIAYAMSAETEGLLIRLDPRKVLAWCHSEFDWALPDPDLLTDKTAAHAHLLQTCPALTMSPADVFRETKYLNLKHSAPFHLLHTISHCLLSVAKRHTGYDEKSLAEYLLPMDLSFLVYVTSVQNYTAGGLLTLFKHYLLTWFDDASNFSFQCVFDPVCSDQGASCSGCVQRVIGCETFNRGLSRAYLFGGEAIEEEKQLVVGKGFWHV